VAVSTVRSGQSGVYAGITGGHRAIVLRPYGRAGLDICQAGSLGATHESGRPPGSGHQSIAEPVTGHECNGPVKAYIMSDKAAQDTGIDHSQQS
jgi:hypothetical protein